MKSQQLIRSVIQRIAVGPNRGRDISRSEAEHIMALILAGEVDEVQAGVILIALRMKRESVDEMLGLFSALSQQTNTVVADVSKLFCLADPFDGYQRCLPMTPFVPAVLAALEMPACLVGVFEVGPKFGVTAEKVYKLAGIDVSVSPEQAKHNIQRCGWAYLSQASYAPQLYALQELRDRIVKRSALTTLERLLNPLRGSDSTHAVLGYVHKAYPEIYSAVAQHAGFDSALLTKGVEGGLAPAINKPLRQYRIDFNSDNSELVRDKQQLPPKIMADSAAYLCDPDQGATTQATLELGGAVLSGACDSSVVGARNSLILAVANIVYAYNRQLTLLQAVEKVQNCLDNGSALKSFNDLGATVNSF